MKFKRYVGITRLCLGFLLGSLLAANTLSAATISNLYNTGVDNFNNALPLGGMVDPHYIISVSPSGPMLARTVTDTAFPFPPWVANNYTPGAGSRWIGPEASSQGPAGNYRYRTTFTLPANTNLSTVSINGLWSTDDGSINININGNPTGAVASGFNALWPFSITSGFVLGTNVLTFDLNNAGGPTGLRVDRMVGTYQVIPEPGALLLAISAAGICVALVQRRRKVLR